LALLGKTRVKFSGTPVGLVALLFGFSVMSYFDRTIMSIAGPEIIKQYNVEPASMGWVYSAFVLTYAIFMIPGGHLVDRLGSTTILTLMGLAAALFTALTPLAGQFLVGLGGVPVLVLNRGGLGIMSAPLYPACARMCAAWIPKIHQTGIQAFVIAGACVGGAASPILFTWLMSMYGWRKSFLVAAAATAALALLWLRYVRKMPDRTPVKSEHNSMPKSWRQLLLNRSLLLLTFAYLTVGYFEYIFFYWIYYYFGEVRQTGFAQSARYTTVIFLVMLVMMPLGGWISDFLGRLYGLKLARRVVPLAGLTMGSLLLYLGVKVSETSVASVLLALAVGFASFCEGPFWTMAADIGGPQAGAAGGIMNAGGNLGGFLSPVLTPLVAKFFGWSWGLYTGSIVAMLGAVACCFINTSTETPQTAVSTPSDTIPVHFV